MHTLFEEALRAGRDRDYRRAVELLQSVICSTDEIPEALLYLGRGYHALEDYPRAIGALESYLRRSPESVRGHFFLGRSYLALGVIRPAVGHLLQAVRLDEGFVPALGLAGLALLRDGRPRTAVEYFERALRLDPNQAQIFTGYLNALLTHAVRLFRRRRYEEALQHFEFIGKHRPDSLPVNLYLARIHRELGDAARAVEHLDRATALAPDDPVLYLQKAATHLAGGNHTEAYQELSRGMELLGRTRAPVADPDSLLRLITVILFQNRRFREALRSGRRLLRRQYGDPELHALVAECLRNIGELRKAGNHFRRAIEGAGDREELYYGLAGVLWEAEEYQELARVLRRLRRLSPRDPVAGYYMALSMPFLGAPYDQTIPALQEEIRRSGPDLHLMLALGREYLRAELPELAVGWFRRTLRREEANEEALYCLLEAQKRLEDGGELRSAYTELLKHYPQDREVQREYVRLLFDQQDYQEASNAIVRLLPYEAASLQLRKMLAISYRKLKRYGEAVPLFRELLREDPTSEPLLRSLVYCLEETGNRREAIRLLEKAVPVFRARPSVLLPLGVMYFKEGQMEKAASTFRLVLSAVPGDWKAHLNLARVYRETGNSEFARRYQQRAEELRAGG